MIHFSHKSSKLSTRMVRYFSKSQIDRSMLLERPIFLDNQATTPIDPRVVEVVIPHLTRDFGNPHSTAHVYGTNESKICERAREQVAACINAKPNEIIFMSGATEANNLSIKGMARSLGTVRNNIITFSTEHKCVLESCYDLQKENIRVTVLPVKRSGLIELDQLREHVTEETLMVSAMGVNNEIGVVQPLKEIGQICRENGAYFHSDAAQAIGKIGIDVEDMNIDFLSKLLFLTLFRLDWPQVLRTQRNRCSVR